MNPLTATEKAYFDTIKGVATSPRPGDLSLHRMGLDGREVAVVAQRLIRTEDGTTAGLHPLALILDDETAARLTTADGKGPEATKVEGLEGAA